MAANNPIHNEYDHFRKRWSIWFSAVEAELREYNFTIDTPNKELRSAINKTVNKHGYVPELTENMMVGIMNSAAIGGAALLPSAQSWWLKHHFHGDEFTLQERIYDSAKDTKLILYNTIRDQLRASASWSKVAQAVYKTGIPSGNLPKYMNDLLVASRRAIEEPTEFKKYERIFKNTKKQIDKLAANGAPTSRLRKAYQNLLEKSLNGSQLQIDKAIERATRAKAKYISDRLARTEFAKAYGNAQWYNMAHDNDVVAYRSSLSTRHKITDICDVHAQTDQYGMGPGIYPVGKGPPYPYHPQCMCKLTPVYSTEVEVKRKPRTEDISRYMEEHPQKAKRIMGAGNYKKFLKDKKNPQKYIPNWKKHEKHKTELRRGDIEN